MSDEIPPLPGDAGEVPYDFKRARRKKAELRDPSKIDRLPPHSIEAEQGTLGCLMLSPGECVAYLVNKYRKHGPDVYYDLRHRQIYETVVEMYDAREAIDLITVQQKLRDESKLDGIGGVAYLASLPDAVPSAANIGYYVDIVLEKYFLRRMIGTCSEVVSRAYEHQGEVDELMDQFEADVLGITRDRVADSQIMTSRELAHASVNLIEEMHQRQGAIMGLATGFADLDKMTSGLQKGEMIVIAARPSIGKTSLAMNIVENVALLAKIPVGVFSLEMRAESLGLRMICSLARVNLRNISEGFLAERDFPKITSAAGKMSAAPLYIDDTPGLSIMQLRAKARLMHREHDLKLLVIDYMQLLHSTNRRAENRQQEIADISGGIKSLAKELDIPIIAISQLNRDSEKNARKPKMADLRESGAIEQDSDVIGLLYRPVGEAEDEQSQDAVPVNLYIAKQRNGPTGEIAFTFLKCFTRFESAAKISSEDVPQE